MSLEAIDLTFGYPGCPPLIDGLCITVEPGASVAIMAPSGTGKSTLLSLLGGVRRPQQGRVLVTRPLHSEPWRPDVSWVFQSMHLLPQRTALENVMISMLSRGVSRQSAHILAERELERFGVGAVAHRAQKTLSGGESQRVALARAAVCDPLLVLADEPTANLDQANARRVAEVLFGGFPRAALVVVTHDQNLAAGATRSLRMVDGRLRP